MGEGELERGCRREGEREGKRDKGRKFESVIGRVNEEVKRCKEKNE